MNKGIEIATGDVIGFLNSDDFFAMTKLLINMRLIFPRILMLKQFMETYPIYKNDIKEG